MKNAILVFLASCGANLPAKPSPPAAPQDVPSASSSPATTAASTSAVTPTATFEIRHESGRDLDFDFIVDGRTLIHRFHVPARRTTRVDVPIGRDVFWNAGWGETLCERSPKGDAGWPLHSSPKPGDTIRIRCDADANLGMCCQPVLTDH